MTAVFMEDVGFTLESAQRRRPLAALNGRSLSFGRPAFPRTKTTGNAYIDDLVVLSVKKLSDVHVESSPIDMQRADALYDSLQMPTNLGKSGSALSRELW